MISRTTARAICICAVAVASCSEMSLLNSVAPVPTDGSAANIPDLGAIDGLLSNGELIGVPCDIQTPGTCGANGVCLSIDHGGTEQIGMCGLRGCAVEDILTPEQEDLCPLGSACVTYEDRSERITACLPTCEPAAGNNPCAAKHTRLACDPKSALLNGRTPVCITAACTVDEDCGNRNPLAPDFHCDRSTGVCFSLGQENRSVGDRCFESGTCGEGQMCFIPDQVAVSGISSSNTGYCTILGCRFGGPWQCPEGSGCYSIGSDDALSICLAEGCDPSMPVETSVCGNAMVSDAPYECVLAGRTSVCWITPP